MQSISKTAMGQLIRKTCPLRWNPGSARKAPITKLPSVTRAQGFDNLETLITFTKSPYGQKMIKRALESDLVSQEKKDALAKALIPDFFLPDTSELPVYLRGSDKEILATKPVDRALMLECSTVTELEIILKRHMNVAEDVPVKLLYDFGLNSTDEDASFVPNVEFGLHDNLEWAGHISVTYCEVEPPDHKRI